MPPVVRGSWTTTVETDNQIFSSKDMEYQYPNGLDLRPGRTLHDRLVARIMERAQDSYDSISKRHESWNETDEVLTAYIPLSDYEKSLKKKDRTKPVSVVLPSSYAALETVMAYHTKAFLTNQMFQYEGMGPEDEVPAKLLELVVAQQVHRFKAALDVHTGMRDGLAYGIHAGSVVWDEKWGRQPVTRTIPQYTSLGVPLPPKLLRENQRTLLFEGNRINPIDPYCTLPDPNVSIHRIQDGEFFGWFEYPSVAGMLSDEMGGSGLFNIKYVVERRKGNKAGSRFLPGKSKREKSGPKKDETRIPQYSIIVNMYVTLIPREWGLPGDEEYNASGLFPEKWTFSVADDSILVRADRLGLNHDMYPVAVNAPDFDGYSIAPISRMEINSGLQTVLNWEMNSHITNVRKAINDMLVVDPSLVSMTDLQNPEPGKLIRLRRSAWGRGVKDAVNQLAVTDVTRGNVQDAAFIMDMMQKSWATPDAGMGFMRGGSERRSAAEFSGTFGAHISRLEHLARMTSLMYMQDLGYFYASHTQQLMSQETYVRSIGDWPQVLLEEYGPDIASTGRALADPFSIIADFDVIVKDGSDSSVGAEQMQFWTNMMPVLMGNPLLFQVFDITRIFKRVARLSGEKNVNDFIVKGGSMNAQVLGNEQALIEAGKGNLIPLPGEQDANA